MELGNVLMGNSRGKFETADRNLVESTEWAELCDVISFDGYSCGHKVDANRYGGIKCSLFEIRPYYWGDCDCGIDEDSTEEHKEHCSLLKHNFVHNPSGLELDWYKYPFRDSYTNLEISTMELRKIFHECAEACKKMMLISSDSFEKLKYTPMRGLSIGTKQLKQGKECIRLTREFDNGKKVESIGIRADCDGLLGYIFDTESVCDYRSVKGSSDRIIVPKEGKYTLNGKDVNIINPRELHKAYCKVCFLEIRGDLTYGAVFSGEVIHISERVCYGIGHERNNKCTGVCEKST